MSRAKEHRRGWRRGTSFAAASVAVAMALLLAHATPAHATYDPLGTGTVKLTLDKRFTAFLKADALALAPAAPAKRRGRALTLPVAAGKLDPTAAKLEAETEGTLSFESARKRLPLRNLTVKANRAPLLAKVGGGQLKLATSAALDSKRLGFGSELTAKQLKLSAKLATRLNKKLRPETPFSQGQPLGTLLTRAQPLTVSLLPSGKASLDFDPALLAKLDALHVSLNPVFPAEHVGGSFSFPIIAGGAISPDASLGTLRSGGDVEFLQLGGGQVFWHEQWLDLGARSDSAEADLQPSPPYPGKQGRVGILDLGTGALASDPNARAIALSGAPLTMQAATAAAFNQAFAEGKETFKAGEVLGVAGFSAVGE